MTDMGWATEQMRSVNTPQAVVTAVKRLLDVWNTMNHTDDTRDATLHLFTRLASGHSLELPASNERWVAAHRGMLTVRDEVRVRSDAYTGSIGQVHNGRRGKIVAIRSGDIFVLYDGAKAEASVRHPPEKLEKRIQ